MSYESFAYYYDSLMDPQFYEDYYQFINKNCQFQDVLELGCGTGEMAIRFAEDGKQVWATDLSTDMLNIAKQKAMTKNVNLILQRVDMSDFSTSYPLDLIVCLCDSINYLIDPADIVKTFSHVYNSIKENGTFVFDVNSLYKMNVILNQYHEENEEKDFLFQWHVKTLGDGHVHHHVHIEDRIENIVVDENHFQKSYPIQQYLQWLEDAGFKHVSYYSDFDDYKDECERIIFVCRKGSV